MSFVELIDKAYRAGGRSDPPRTYIGASNVGDKCLAYLALSLRGFPEDAPAPSTQRIFRDGHRIEDQVVADLRKAGIDVMDRDPKTGKQWHFEEYGGIFAANVDGLVEWDGQLCILEIKSMRDDYWGNFVASSLRISHPKYYAQVQAAMGLAGLERAVLVAYNKNTARYHEEWIDFDPIFFASLQAKVEAVIDNTVRRVSADPKSFSCRFCFKRGACWGDKDAPREPRTCANYKPDRDGNWSCSNGCTTRCVDWARYVPPPA